MNTCNQHQAVTERIAIKNIGVRLDNDTHDVVLLDGIHGLFTTRAAGKILSANDDIRGGLLAALPESRVIAVKGIIFKKLPVGTLLEKRGRNNVIGEGLLASVGLTYCAFTTPRWECIPKQSYVILKLDWRSVSFW